MGLIFVPHLLAALISVGASTAAVPAAVPSGAAATPAVPVAHLPRTPAVPTRSTPASPARSTTTLPLAGKVIGVDPGHNGRNGQDLAYIDHLIWNGREEEPCNTTGTQTDAGYTEAQFNWNVASDLVVDLRAAGATIVLTRHSNDGVGPCVNERAAIMNRAHAAVAIAIHADGYYPPSGHGFAVLEPVADGINNRVIGPSHRFARILRNVFEAVMPVSTYDGVDGLAPRDNLAGENLTTVPYALIEIGNMRDPSDAAQQITSAFQHRAARAIAQAITEFVTKTSG